MKRWLTNAAWNIVSAHQKCPHKPYLFILKICKRLFGTPLSILIRPYSLLHNLFLCQIASNRRLYWFSVCKNQRLEIIFLPFLQNRKLYLVPKLQFQEHQLSTTDTSLSNLSKIFKKFCIAYHEQLKRRMIFTALTAWTSLTFTHRYMNKGLYSCSTEIPMSTLELRQTQFQKLQCINASILLLCLLSMDTSQRRLQLCKSRSRRIWHHVCFKAPFQTHSTRVLFAFIS